MDEPTPLLDAAIEQALDAAVRWWGDILRAPTGPVHDNMAPGHLPSMLTNRWATEAAARIPRPTAAQIGIFESALRRLLREQLPTMRRRVVVLDVDYQPGWLLRGALRAANLAGDLLPIKTDTSLYPGLVRCQRRGPAPIFTAWPTEPWRAAWMYDYAAVPHRERILALPSERAVWDTIDDPGLLFHMRFEAARWAPDSPLYAELVALLQALVTEVLDRAGRCAVGVDGEALVLYEQAVTRARNGGWTEEWEEWDERLEVLRTRLRDQPYGVLLEPAAAVLRLLVHAADDLHTWTRVEAQARYPSDRALHAWWRARASLDDEAVVNDREDPFGLGTQPYLDQYMAGCARELRARLAGPITPTWR